MQDGRPIDQRRIDLARQVGESGAADEGERMPGRREGGQVDLFLTGDEIANGGQRSTRRGVGGGVEDEDVVPSAAIHQVRAAAAGDCVRAGASHDIVGALAADQRRGVARVAENRVALVVALGRQPGPINLKRFQIGGQRIAHRRINGVVAFA